MLDKALAPDQVLDSYLGRYSNEDELRIGDRSIDDLIELSAKTNVRNFKKFEANCKKHPTEEKCNLILFWCKKMLKVWEEEIIQKPGDYLSSAEGK